MALHHQAEKAMNDEAGYLKLRQETIDRLHENAGHGTRREDIEAAYLAGVSEGLSRNAERMAYIAMMAGLAELSKTRPWELAP